MMKSCTLLAFLAAVSVASEVRAQTEDHLPVGQGTLVIMPSEHPYSGRAIGVTYDNTSNIGSNGQYTFLSGTGKKVVAHISFAGGPWATATNRIITAIDYADCTTPAGSLQAQFAFYRESDGTFDGFGGSGTAMINPAAVPLGNP